MAEWFKQKRRKRKKINPADNHQYIVASDVIPFTETVLREYSAMPEPAEGVVYWCGTITDNMYTVTAAVAPRVTASQYGFLTTPADNARFINFISDNDLIYLAQVHSHPFAGVDHSEVDDNETAFRSEGLVSIVVPFYSEKGMLPLKQCGIHRFSNNAFARLNEKYIKGHFSVSPINKILLKDLRYEY